MDRGDILSPKNMTFARSRVPFFGALIDYMDTSLSYLRQKTFAQADQLQAKASKATLSASFMACVCLMLGLTCNVKLEVVTFDEEPLPSDLHIMLMSKEDKLYIDDIDVTRVMWCIEASDTIVMFISCLLIWNSSNVHAPLSEYLFLPWLGATLRGLFLRQAPTAGALLYTMAVINGNVNPLFVTAFSFLFLLEARLWLEIARIIRSRWERRDHISAARDSQYEVETLWSNDDVESVEVGNAQVSLQVSQASIGYVLEARLWLEIARIIRSRWERRDHISAARDSQYEVETLWSNDDVQSVEVRNYVY